MSRPAAVFALMIGLFYCGCTDALAPPKTAEPEGTAQDLEPGQRDTVRVIDAHTVVFRADSLAAGRADFLMSILPRGPYWEPDGSDIALGRLLVERRLGAKADEYPIRQYIGYLSEDRRIIQVRGLHSDCLQQYDYWRRLPVRAVAQRGLRIHSGL